MNKNMSLFWLLIVLFSTASPTHAQVTTPAALTATGMPAVPDTLAATTRPYMEGRSAIFSGWNARDRSMLISTRFGNVNQLHSVAAPLGMRRQISFELEPLGGSWSPTGETLVVTKDNGGDEFFQIYTLANGKLTLLTAGGKTRNQLGSWSHDGKLIGFSSTERNSIDADLYIMNPHDLTSKRCVAQVKGGGWKIEDFAPGNARAIVHERLSVTKSKLYILEMASGQLTPLGDHSKEISYGEIHFAPDGRLWVTSDENSDVKRLGQIDLISGRFTPTPGQGNNDVDYFAINRNGRTISIITNEAGMAKLSLVDVRSGRIRRVNSIPVGVISGPEFAPWGALGFTLSTAKSPSDAFMLDPVTLKLTRWTESETGGLDPRVNVEPEFIQIKSFDGENISGFLYRPDPRRFLGKRPLIINIHGGPESQSRPGFLGRSNYLLNEQGIAIFFPNVRGSTGHGKRFVDLDNGPFKREDSVKDIGAFLNQLETDPAINGARMAVTGGSYGGYMCYASSIAYGNRLKGALCNVAISNFVTFLENTQSYRQDLRRVEYGDERDPAQRTKLEEISPLRRIGEIKIPVFVVQGANDPRVPKTEADQIVAGIRKQGGTAWYLVGENEGHGFSKKENQDYLFWSTLMFWDQTLLN